MSETPQKTLGKYQIQGELGKGAMGVVYRGFDPALEREVAIKVMGSATVSDPELKKRFEQEAKASARLQHPNIVTVYDFGYDDEGAPYMAMELLKGQDLEQRIRKSPLTLQEKLDVVAQACRGLAHAHEHHIVHRDIKPANIFISESGIAKIMDFGVARLMQSSQTQTGTVLGTADYMSPEQIRGQKVDGRSDIFSAGVILYRLLTNKKPFTGENIQAVFFKVLNQEPPELVLPDGGGEMPELQAIVDKALMKNKDERYESAKDFAADIDDLMHLYQDILNENTVFDTMFDPSAMIDMEPGSDGSGRGRTSPTGRVLGRTSAASRTHRAGTAFPSGRTRTGATAAGRTATGTPTEMMRGTQVGTMSATRVGVGIPIQESSGGVLKWVGLVALLAAVGGGVFWFTQQNVPPEVSAGAAPAPAQPTVDVAGQFVLAERSLASGDGGLVVLSFQIPRRFNNILIDFRLLLGGARARARHHLRGLAAIADRAVASAGSPDRAVGLGRSALRLALGRPRREREASAASAVARSVFEGPRGAGGVGAGCGTTGSATCMFSIASLTRSLRAAASSLFGSANRIASTAISACESCPALRQSARSRAEQPAAHQREEHGANGDAAGGRRGFGDGTLNYGKSHRVHRSGTVEHAERLRVRGRQSATCHERPGKSGGFDRSNRAGDRSDG